jgi:nucleotide-binding universal stress UspA family protein
MRPGDFKRILCSLDLTATSRTTLDYALSLAQEAQAKVTLLNVVENVPEDEGLPLDVPEYRRYRLADAREALRRSVPSDARSRCPIEECVEAGKPYRRILQKARELNADLIVVGAHTNPGLLVLGSTSHHVVREASCPVLTVRPRETALRKAS